MRNFVEEFWDCTSNTISHIHLVNVEPVDPGNCFVYIPGS